MASSLSPAPVRWWLRPPLWWTGFAIWLGTLFTLSSIAMPEIDGPEIPHLDKLEHFVYYALGAACLTLALRLRGVARRSAAVGSDPPRRGGLLLLLVVILIISGIGALDEWYQTFNPTRTGADPADWLADLLGATAGAGAALRLRRL